MKSIPLFISVVVTCVLPVDAVPISITDLNAGYSQNFDTLVNSGTSSTMPAGWEFLETGSGANTTYAAGTGSGTGGNTYSFGAASSTERALGGLRSGTVIPSFGASFQNNTLSLISSFQISYVGEQWRLGTAGRADRLDFQFSLNATTLSDGTWTDVNGLDFSAPVTSGAAGALDGNASANRQSLLATLSAINWSVGSTLSIRWNDLDATGADDGLGVDDFSLQSVPASNPNPVPESLPFGFQLATLLALLGGARFFFNR